MKQILSVVILTFLMISGISTHAQKLKRQDVSYSSSDGVVCKSYVSYDRKIKGKRPVVLVIPEWWGLNNYARKRADMLAELGYLAIAVDIYGEGKQGNDPGQAQALATPFYQNPSMALARIESAKQFINMYPQADADVTYAIGYCFGGSMVLNAVGLGLDVDKAVSFHGGLGGLVAPKKGNKTEVLVCHGLADKFITEEDLNSFRRNMNDSGISYQFIEYADATHAFTNPDATANGQKFGIPIAYNEAADKKSWADMLGFFGRKK